MLCEIGRDKTSWAQLRTGTQCRCCGSPAMPRRGSSWRLQNASYWRREEKNWAAEATEEAEASQRGSSPDKRLQGEEVAERKGASAKKCLSEELLTHPFVRSFVDSLIHCSFIQSFNSLIDSFSQSVIHSISRSLLLSCHFIGISTTICSFVTY